ncbi:MAG: cobalt-precorrin-4 C(11)-methyltransferase, partial [Deltaproteobacteria bacterium]|nr:cobalt-precorrin-4 C(11)-methyltransferase [Deltaproteobacteria bacterium]
MDQKKRACQVYFIGAGPGDPDLITVKGQKCIQKAGLVLYAGSLVPKEVVNCAKENAEVVDSSSMTLDETHAMI